MKELNEVKQALKYLEIDAKAYADNFSASMIVSTKTVLAIAEAFRSLEQEKADAEMVAENWKQETKIRNSQLDLAVKQRNQYQERAEAAEAKLYRQESIIPEGLTRCTAELVMDFAKALAEKLHRSEQKYGWSDGWKESDWQDKCLADFHRHISKGDPRDVAAYCAFMWHHEWPTRPAPAVSTKGVSDGED